MMVGDQQQQLREKAATSVQAASRGWTTRRWVRRRAQASTHIQSRYRGRRSRLETARQGAGSAFSAYRLHVRNIGVDGWDGTDQGRGTFENEGALSDIFSVFGAFVNCIIRHKIQDPNHKVEKDRGPRANTSWALVTMGDQKSVDLALKCAAEGAVRAGEAQLEVKKFDKKIAIASKGGMALARGGLSHRLHVRNVGAYGWNGKDRGRGAFESEGALTKLFNPFGGVVNVFITHQIRDPNHKSTMHRGPRANTSWALVTMEDSLSIERALAATVMAGSVKLDVERATGDLAKAGLGYDEVNAALSSMIARISNRTSGALSVKKVAGWSIVRSMARGLLTLGGKSFV